MPSLYVPSGFSVAVNAANRTGLNATLGVTVAFWSRNARSTGTLVGDVFRHTSTANANRDGYRIGFGSAGGIGIRVCGAATNTDSYGASTATMQKNRKWQHWCLTFDDATNFVRGYLNGRLVLITTNTTDMTANAACTTAVPDSGIQGGFNGMLFDLRVMPDYVASVAEVRALMDPAFWHPAVKGRYFGRGFRSTVNGEVVRDESENGNDLTLATNAHLAEEPPLLPTFQ